MSQPEAAPEGPQHEITIYVNNRPVAMPDREVNGAEIKQAASVPDDFSLYLEQGGKLIPVADGEPLKIHELTATRSVPPHEGEGG